MDSERSTEHQPGTGSASSLLGWIDRLGHGRVVPRWGTVKADTFTGFIRRHLLPELEPGDLVVWDHAKIHDSPALEHEIIGCGAELHRLPRCSPELNAIEMLWSKLKHYVKRARTDRGDLLLPARQQAAKQVHEEDMRGWFAHCGYLPHSV